jgi:hypothetical protein
MIQHFTGKDLLKMSEVSMSWNEIAENQKIGEKVRLNLKLYSMTDEELKIIKDSSREYKTVTMEFNILERFADLQTLSYDMENLYSFSNYKCFLELTQKILRFKITDHDSWLKVNLNDIEELKLKVVYEYFPKCDLDYENIHQFVVKQKNLKGMDISESHSDFRKKYEENSLVPLKYQEANDQRKENL